MKAEAFYKIVAGACVAGVLAGAGILSRDNAHQATAAPFDARQRIEELTAEVAALRAESNARFDSLQRELERLNAQLATLNRR